MNSIKSIAIAATLAITGMAAATAAEQTWNDRPQNWTYGATPSCRLTVQRVYQPNQGQPIHLVVKNASNVRLKYTIQVRVIRGHQEEFKGSILVDNANPGEVSERPTSNAYRGVLSGAVVQLSLTSCALRN